jgi:hypothetical protein
VLALFAYCGACNAERVLGFGMRTYKKIGTDPVLLACYTRYQQFCSALKLDLLFQIQLAAFCLLGFRALTWRWIATLAVHVPVALAWLPCGLAAVRRESVTLLRLLLLAACFQPLLYAAMLLTDPRYVPGPAGGAHAVLGANSPHWALGLGVEMLPDETLSTGHDSAAVAASAMTNMSYCTQRLRESTFPFSPALGTTYLLAILTRLLLLSVAILSRANFGLGLATRVHQRDGPGVFDRPNLGVRGAGDVTSSSHHLDGYAAWHGTP